MSTDNINELQDVDIPNIYLTSQNNDNQKNDATLKECLLTTIPTAEQNLQNEINKLKKDKVQLEQIIRLLQNSLKLERAEKLMLINENSQLREQIVAINKKK